MKQVLFVCNHNAGRSQIAQALFERHAPDDVRAIRYDIEQRVRTLVVDRLGEIRTDRTAHQLRLARLLPDLVAEFDGRRTPDEICACADAILADYDDAPVRSFLLPLATRRTRECLQADTCAATAPAAAFL